MLLAAGLGRRYGGVKSLAPVGPNREPLLLVSLEQAAAAGFAEAVIVVGAATEQPIRRVFDRLSDVPMSVRFVSQNNVGPPRPRPWGTVAAVLAAGGDRDVVVANGDDLYGAAGLAAARSWSLAGAGDGAAILYRVGKTMSDVGGVSRAVPVLDNGRLRGLVEQREVRLMNGSIRLADGTELDAEQPVSMNLWCLRRSVLVQLRAAFGDFVRSHRADPTAEFGLPAAISDLSSDMRFEALVTDSPWHGVTFAADVAGIRASLTARERT